MNFGEAFVKWAGMNPDPGYYAGYGPSPGDISSERLEKIYNGLKTDIGQQAATNFVHFVQQITDLSASAFISSFQRFVRAAYVVPAHLEVKGDRDRISEHAQAFGLLSLALGGGRPNEADVRRLSAQLKAAFLQQHADELLK